MSLIFNSEQSLPDNFSPVERVTVKNILDAENLQECINSTCVKLGEPLVLSGFDKTENWDFHLFSPHYLQANHGNKFVYMTEQLNGSTTSLNDVPLNELIKKILEESSSFLNNTNGTSIKHNKDSLQKNFNLKGKEIVTSKTPLYNMDKNTLENEITKILQDNEVTNSSVKSTIAYESRRLKSVKKLEMLKEHSNRLESEKNQEPVYFSSMSATSTRGTKYTSELEVAGSTSEITNGKSKALEYKSNQEQLNNYTADVGQVTLNESSSSSNNNPEYKEKTNKNEPAFAGYSMKCTDDYIEKLEELIPNFLLSLDVDNLNKFLPILPMDGDTDYICSLNGNRSNTNVSIHTSGSIYHNLMLSGDKDAYSQRLIFSKYDPEAVFRFLKARKNQANSILTSSSHPESPSSYYTNKTSSSSYKSLSSHEASSYHTELSHQSSLTSSSNVKDKKRQLEFEYEENDNNKYKDGDTLTNSQPSSVLYLPMNGSINQPIIIENSDEYTDNEN
ncbi:unnamed protein product [Cunninghamella blakesleeana]